MNIIIPYLSGLYRYIFDNLWSIRFVAALQLGCFVISSCFWWLSLLPAIIACNPTIVQLLLVILWGTLPCIAWGFSLSLLVIFFCQLITLRKYGGTNALASFLRSFSASFTLMTIGYYIFNILAVYLDCFDCFKLIYFLDENRFVQYLTAVYFSWIPLVIVDSTPYYYYNVLNMFVWLSVSQWGALFISAVLAFAITLASWCRHYFRDADFGKVIMQTMGRGKCR